MIREAVDPFKTTGSLCGITFKIFDRHRSNRLRNLRFSLCFALQKSRQKLRAWRALFNEAYIAPDMAGQANCLATHVIELNLNFFWDDYNIIFYCCCAMKQLARHEPKVVRISRKGG